MAIFVAASSANTGGESSDLYVTTAIMARSYEEPTLFLPWSTSSLT
jgi:hypothetical protein